MRDRLIELLRDIKENPEKTCPRSNTDEQCRGCRYDVGGDCDVVARRADHLLANNVIALPIGSGDTIYRPFFQGVESWVVTAIVLYPEEIVFIDDSENSFKESDIGVSVFLTKEEAEAALVNYESSKKEMQGK